MPGVQHNVIVKLKPFLNLSENNHILNDVMRQLEALQQSITGIRSIHHGRYSSPEGLNKGFDYGFSVVFESEEDRNVYLQHPAHEVVKDALIAIIDDVIAFDFLL